LLNSRLLQIEGNRLSSTHSGLLALGDIWLANREMDIGGEVYTIKRTVRVADYGIDIMKFYRSGILQKGFSSF